MYGVPFSLKSSIGRKVIFSSENSLLINSSSIPNSIICGFGVKGYIMALEAMKNILSK